MSEVNLSIIVPVYNKEKYIQNCLLSILNQSFTDFEVVVINDGSTDSSEKIVRELARTDQRIRCYSFENGGVSVARNRGLEYVRGNFILFIDSDDWIEPDYLSGIMQKVHHYSADLYLWGISKDYQNHTEQILPKQTGLKSKKEFLTDFVEEQYHSRQGLYGYIANKLLRTEIIKKYHLRFDAHIRQLEDYNFFLDYYKHCTSVFCFAETGYHYVLGTLFSSGQSVLQVDYLSMIDIHLKCFRLLEENECLTFINQNCIQQALGSLCMSSFLEMKLVSKQNIHKLLGELKKRTLVWNAFKKQPTNFKLLKQLLLRQQEFLVYIYLRFWRFYLSVRQN